MLRPGSIAKPASFSRIRDLVGDEMWRTIVARYVWWESASEADTYPERVVARVMRMADFDDAEKVASLVGDEILRDVLTHAEAGWFDEPSWHYWHYRLGLCSRGAVPPLPTRAIP